MKTCERDWCADGVDRQTSTKLGDSMLADSEQAQDLYSTGPCAL